MHSECMDEMANKVRQLRAETKARKRRLGYPDNSSNPAAAFLDGQITGMTEVLQYICPNPHED